MEEFDYTIGGQAIWDKLAEEAKQRQQMLANPEAQPATEKANAPGATITPYPVKAVNMTQQQYQAMQQAYTTVAPNSMQEIEDQKPGPIGKVIGTTLHTLGYVLSPLSAPSAFILAPWTHEPESKTFTGKQMEYFSVGARAAWQRLFPTWGEPSEAYGKEILDRLIPQAPESVKASLGVGLEVLTDPTVIYGGFFYKTVQLGTQITRAQVRAGLIPAEGIMTSGVRRMFLMGAVDDPVERTGIYALARKVDGGDLGAAKELSELFSKEEYEKIAASLEEVASKQYNEKISDAFGITEAHMIDKEIAALTKTELKNKAGAMVDEVAEGLRTQGVPEKEIRQTLKTVKQEAEQQVAAQGLSAEELGLIKEKARQTVAATQTEKYNEFVIDLMEMSGESGERLKELIESGQLHKTIKINKPLTSPENTEAVTVALANRFVDMWRKATRGRVSWAESMGQAQKIEYEAITGRKVGELWNAETIFAASQVRKVLADEAAKMALAVRTTGDPVYNVAYWQSLNAFKKITANLRGSMAEWGRTGKAAQAGPEVYNSISIKAAEEAIEIAGRMTDEGIDTIVALHADLFEKMDKVGGSQRFLDRFPKLLENFENAVYESYLNGLLSAVTTSVKNVASNSTMAVMQPFEQLMRVPFGGGMDAVREAGVMMQGLAEGTKDALFFYADLAAQTKYGGKILPRKVKDAAQWRMLKIEKEYPARYLDPEGIAGATTKYSHELDQLLKGRNIASVNFGIKPESLLGKGIDKSGAFIRLPGTALRLQDLGFKFLGYRMGIRQNALQKAMRYTQGDRKGFSKVYNDILSNPAEEVIAAGESMADYITFQTQLGKTASKFQALAQARYLRWFFPFIRTNINLLKRGAERSVLGYIPAITNLIKGNPAQAQRAAAQATLGTAIMGAVAASIDTKHIVGHYDLQSPYGRKMAALQIPQYSILIGDKWISYEGIDFLRTTLGMVANYKAAAAALDLEDPEDIETMEKISLATMSAMAKFAFDPGWVREIGHLMYFYDTVASGSVNLGESSRRVIGGTMAMAIPYSRLLAQFNQNYVDEEFRMANGFITGVMKELPGLSSQLPAYRDLWGDPLLAHETLGPDLMHRTYNFVSPFKIRTTPNDLVRRELLENPVELPSMVRNIMGVKLTKTEKSEVQRLTGKGIGGIDLYTALERMMTMPSYQRAKPPARAYMIQQVYLGYREQAKMALVNDSMKNDPSPESLYQVILKKQEWRKEQFTPAR